MVGPYQGLTGADHKPPDTPINMPPTTTVASGRCTWLPMPVEQVDLLSRQGVRS